MKALEEIKAKHKRHRAAFTDEDGCTHSRGYRCVSDDDPWSCDAAKLVAALEKAVGIETLVRCDCEGYFAEWSRHHPMCPKGDSLKTLAAIEEALSK